MEIALKPIDDCFNYPVDQQLDACGMRCPLPLLKAKQALRDLANGQLLRVLSTDVGSVRDFRSYAELSGHELYGFQERDSTYCYLLKKCAK
jgi:tRNA 2-thiouridine synthesizing protein A